MTEAFKQGYNDYLMKVAGIVEPGGPSAWIESAKPVTEAVPAQSELLSPIDHRIFGGLKRIVAQQLAPWYIGDSVARSMRPAFAPITGGLTAEQSAAIDKQLPRHLASKSDVEKLMERNDKGIPIPTPQTK